LLNRLEVNSPSSPHRPLPLSFFSFSLPIQLYAIRCLCRSAHASGVGLNQATGGPQDEPRHVWNGPPLSLHSSNVCQLRRSE
jgi:hypothetical protein